MKGYYGNVGNRAGYEVNTLGYDGHNTSRFAFGDFRHELTLGGDIFEDDVENFDEADLELDIIRAASAGFGAVSPSSKPITQPGSRSSARSGTTITHSTAWIRPAQR
jgi:outer membrane receptor protein involved in Fe transport